MLKNIMEEILQIYMKNKIDCVMGDPGIDCGAVA